MCDQYVRRRIEDDGASVKSVVNETTYSAQAIRRWAHVTRVNWTARHEAYVYAGRARGWPLKRIQQETELPMNVVRTYSARYDGGNKRKRRGQR